MALSHNPNDIEGLSKGQLILLTVFISFVISTATGVVTVALLQEAPQTVTQTINRVVERTIERVVSDTKVQEVITNPEDLIAKAVAGASPSLVRVVSIPLKDSDEGASSTPLSETNYRGSGFVLAPYGVVVASSRAVQKGVQSYAGFLRSGADVDLVLKASYPEAGIAVFEMSPAPNKKNPGLSFAKNGLSLGKTVIAPALGVDTDTVGIGAISALAGGTASSTPRLETTILVEPDSVGAPIIDTRGLLVGMQVGERRALHAEVIKSLVEQALKPIDSSPKNQ